MFIMIVLSLKIKFVYWIIKWILQVLFALDI